MLDLELDECQTASQFNRLLAKKRKADIETLREACEVADARAAKHEAALNAPKPNQVSGPDGLLYAYRVNGFRLYYFWAANYCGAIEYVRSLGLQSIEVSAICTE